MQINITVRNQSIIDICPCVVLAEDSQNYVTAAFTFLTDDWENTEKTAQFQNPKTGEVYESILDSSNACTVRWEALADSGDMNVAVFGANGGYRITTNMGVITVLPTLSGGESDTPPSPDVYQQLLTMLGQKADNMTYSDNVLKLLSGSKELARVIIAGGGSSVQPDWNQNDSGAADYIKNRPFYDDTNVLLEWDGNTEGLVTATNSGGEVEAYKISEYINPLPLPGTTTILFEDGWTTSISSDDTFAYADDEIVETYGWSHDGKRYGYLAFVKNDNVESVYSKITYPKSGVYWCFFDETEIKVSQIYADVFKLPNKYLNLDVSLDKYSENPVQNKAVAAMEDRLPVVITSNGRDLASGTADWVAEMIEKGVLVAGIPNGYEILTFPEVHSSGSENKVYFFPPYISPDRPNETGRVLVGNELIGLDINPYTRLIPPPLSQNAGKVLMVGTVEDEAVFSWQSLPDGLFVVYISLSQSTTFSASYDEITSAISAGKVVIGVVNDGTSASIKLASSYWDTQEERVYFYSIDGFDGWKSVYVGASSRGYDATRYQSDVPTLTVDDLETNAGCVIIVSSIGGSYQLKKLTAEDVNALSGTTANSWADVPELLANYDTVLYNTTYGNRPEGLRPPALIVAAATERGTRQLSILDGAGQIWTGSVDLSSGTITVKKVDAGIQTLNLGAASDVDIRELEEGICRVITDSGEINLNGFSGSVSGSGTSVTMATYSANCLYLAVSREESSSGITIVVNVLDQAMPTQIVCEANGTGNYVSWTSTKTDIKDICLSKDNTTEYTPTGDYNPATKKYVDDAVGGVSAATPRQQMQNTDTTVTLQPNTLYVFPEMATLAVTLATPTNTNIVNEYHFFFTSGATATTLTLPDDIVSDMSVEANRRYEVSIMDGYLAWISWEVVAGA